MKKVFIATLLSAATVFAGCSTDKMIAERVEAGQKLIQLTIGDQTDIETRATTGNERIIDDAYLLVFSVGSGKFKQGEKVNPVNITGTATKPKITSTLSIATGDQIVVLCNTGHTTMPVFNTSHNMSDVNSRFTFPAYADYNQASTNSGRKMPMSGRMVWGTDDECNIFRSVAKVELVLSIEEDITGAFTPGNVQWNMFNININGNIYSNEGQFSIPTSSTYQDNTTFDRYPAGSVGRETAVYLPECGNSYKAKGVVLTDLTAFSKDRTCLIIRTGASAAMYRYHRIDFYDQTIQKYLDIRRNHAYKVTIKKVRSDGYLTYQEALGMPPGNIEYQIDVTDNPGVVATNGHYALNMSHDEIHIFDAQATEYELFNVGYTDPTGVVAASGNIVNTITASDNITLSNPTQQVTSTMTSVKAKFKTGKTDGEITIRLGNLTRVIPVRNYGQLSAAAAVKTTFFVTAGTTLGLQIMENDNNMSMTATDGDFTLTSVANAKPVVRRFQAHITRKHSGGTYGLVRVMGKQTPGS